MKAEIKTRGIEGKIIISKEVKTIGELDEFLMNNGLLRSIQELRKDIKADSVTYFIEKARGE